MKKFNSLPRWWNFISGDVFHPVSLGKAEKFAEWK
jgi:hypothetical protein